MADTDGCRMCIWLFPLPLTKCQTIHWNNSYAEEVAMVSSNQRQPEVADGLPEVILSCHSTVRIGLLWPYNFVLALMPWVRSMCSSSVAKGATVDVSLIVIDQWKEKQPSNRWRAPAGQACDEFYSQESQELVCDWATEHTCTERSYWGGATVTTAVEATKSGGRSAMSWWFVLTCIIWTADLWAQCVKAALWVKKITLVKFLYNAGNEI